MYQTSKTTLKVRTSANVAKFAKTHPFQQKHLVYK